MPELPEVETTRRGIAPHVVGRKVEQVLLRRGDLRWPIPAAVGDLLPGQTITAVERRAKYLLMHTARGSALLHLGMSGSLRVLPAETPLTPHDHVDLRLDSAMVLRLNDPRRFGCLLWQAPGETHPLLAKLGPEPLSSSFDGGWLAQRARGRAVAVKPWLMNQDTVVGVGNIYASEALFAARIHPERAAGSIARARFDRLAEAIKRILQHSIDRGGTTLRDFLQPDGAPGYFAQELDVYGREGEPCRVCGGPVRAVTLGQRSTFYCARCQR